MAEVYNGIYPAMGMRDSFNRHEYLYAGRSLLFVEEIQENQRYRHQNSSDNNVTRYFQDRLGSTITTVTGNRKENYTYGVFGSNMEGDLENAYMVGFNGKREDEVTGFYNYGFRDYSPEMLRFTTEDPIRSGLNWYVYVNNDPVNKIDPLGLWASDARMLEELAQEQNKLPVAPEGVSVDSNINAVKDMSAFDFYDAVKNGGAWDYKQLGSEYQDFGNFNYGATGKAAGFSEDTLLRAAGWAQERAGTSLDEWGNWYGEAPYGDDPADQEQIIKGFYYYDSNNK